MSETKEKKKLLQVYISPATNKLLLDKVKNTSPKKTKSKFVEDILLLALTGDYKSLINLY
jgi:hypothetical protein